ncbi:endonuclease NucS domain-containing protein [Vibrio fluvialis]|uniref:endonuclease NucS domain-containing protein n=1 Tax=Vibrio fluvialis TaxID=676 RepID=UPI001868F41C
MEVEFTRWLNESGNDWAVPSYPESISRLSSHYSEQTGSKVNIYELKDIRDLKNLQKLYGKNGKFSNIGQELDGAGKSALSYYVRFYSQLQAQKQNEILMQAVEDFCNDAKNDEMQNYKKEVQEYCTQQISMQPQRQAIQLSALSMNFAYEKDLQQTLCVQVSELFPGYEIFGGVEVGIEYPIGTRRIDVLLENMDNKSLLIVELKAGLADYKVFGQISMYLGLIKRKFSERLVEGVIIAGEIEESLVQAAETNSAVKLMTYQMSLKLEEV